MQAISIPAKSGSPAALMVMLHGWGANAEDVAFLCSLLDLPDCQFVLPDAPLQHPYSPAGKMWYDLADNVTFQSDLSTQPDLQTSRQLLLDWLKSLPALTGVSLDRTFLGGFSQGGAMTLDVGLALPLAGLLVLSGYLHRPLSAQPSYPPILMVHGRQDPVVPLVAAARSRAALDAIAAPVTYQEFDMGHEISPLVLNEIQQFITLNVRKL
jgi:phospholipase/carboxylesterase